MCYHQLKKKTKTKKTNLQRQKADKWLPGHGKKGLEGEISKGSEETLGSNGFIHYLNCSDGSMSYVLHGSI